MSSAFLLVLSAPAEAGFGVSSSRNINTVPGVKSNPAGLLFDSDLNTAWECNPETENVGQEIWLDVPAGEVDKLGAVIGWAKSDEAFTDYARLAKAHVTILDLGSGPERVVAEADVAFEDRNGWQVVELPDTRVGGQIQGGRVKIRITEVFGGKDFPNLSVSELRVHMKEFPAENVQYGVTPDTEVADHDGGMAIDGDPKTFWAATGPSAAFTFKAPGYGLASIALIPGPRTHARPRTIALTAQQRTVTAVMEDKPEPQWLLLPCIVGYTGGAWGEISVKIVDSYPGEQPANGVAVSEFKVNAASIEDF